MDNIPILMIPSNVASVMSGSLEEMESVKKRKGERKKGEEERERERERERESE